MISQGPNLQRIFRFTSRPLGKGLPLQRSRIAKKRSVTIEIQLGLKFTFYTLYSGGLEPVIFLKTFCKMGPRLMTCLFYPVPTSFLFYVYIKVFSFRSFVSSTARCPALKTVTTTVIFHLSSSTECNTRKIHQLQVLHTIHESAI